MFSMWTYICVAAAIAAIGFVLGQFASGLGVAFVVASSSIWAAYSVKRQNASKFKP